MYKVLYEPLETFRQLSVEVANTTGLVLVLMELHPFVDYNISVRAYTSVGNGPYSDPIQERTLEDRKQFKSAKFYILLYSKMALSRYIM